MTTASISHLSSVVAANADAIDKDASKAHVVFKASAQAHDAVASTISLGKYSVEVDEPPASAARTPQPILSSTTLLPCSPARWSPTRLGGQTRYRSRRHLGQGRR